MTEFEEGVVWALELLKKQCGDRYDRIEQLKRGVDSGVGLVLNGMQNFLGDVRSDFETEVVRTVRTAAERKEQRETQAVLWAHLVSEHAVVLEPDTDLGELVDLHDHEHRGPGTVRNHDPKSRDYSLPKLCEVLSEADD